MPEFQLLDKSTQRARTILPALIPVVIAYQLPKKWKCRYPNTLLAHVPLYGMTLHIRFRGLEDAC